MSPRTYLFGSIECTHTLWFARILAFTTAMFFGYWFLHAAEWLTIEGFHLDETSERIDLPLPFPLLPTWALPFFMILVGIGIILFCILKYRRWGALLLLLCVLYVQGADSLTSFTINKLLVTVFSMFVLGPVPFKQDGQWFESAWLLRLLQVHLCIQYLTAGTCKIFFGDWMQEPYAVWSQIQGIYRTEFASFLLQTMPKQTWAFFQYLTLVFEVGAPILFFWKKTRPYAWIIGIGFHGMIALCMNKLIFFSAHMISYYILFPFSGKDFHSEELCSKPD